MAGCWQGSPSRFRRAPHRGSAWARARWARQSCSSGSSAEASERRLQLASSAGALSLAIDTADSQVVWVIERLEEERAALPRLGRLVSGGDLPVGQLRADDLGDHLAIFATTA